MARMEVAHGVYVDIDNPPCGDAKFNSPKLSSEVKAAAEGAFYAQPLAAGVIALGLADEALGELLKAGVQDAGTLGKLLRDITNQPQVSNCARLVVVLPKTVNITRIEKQLDCYMGGWCAWLGEPTTEEVDAELFAVSGVAKNWSHDRSVTATIKVFYRRD